MLNEITFTLSTRLLHQRELMCLFFLGKVQKLNNTAMSGREGNPKASDDGCLISVTVRTTYSTYFFGERFLEKISYLGVMTVHIYFILLSTKRQLAFQASSYSF